jgi:hypothetical protein
MDPSIRGRIASYSSWGNTADRTARTAPARAALEQKFLEQVSDHITDPEARRLAAESIRRAYYLRLAAKSADSRARRLRERADDAEANLAAGGDAA